MDTANESGPAWKAIAESERFIREHPGQSSLAAMGIGFLIAQLPGRHLFGLFFKLTLLILKSTAVVYAVDRLLSEARVGEGVNGMPEAAHNRSAYLGAQPASVP